MIEKIDIVEDVIYVYDSSKLVKTVEISTLEGVDLSYLNGAKLFTFNLENPTKRVVKFSEVNALNSTAEFVEYLYNDMTEQQKLDFDNFVALINNL